MPIRFLVLFAAVLASNAVFGASDKTQREELRLVFESRMLRVALEQSQKISGYWDPAQRDCAGFVRFVYYRTFGDSAKKWQDRSSNFVDYVPAEDLLHFNFEFHTLNADPREMRSGDLLAFYSAEKKPTDRWHLMLVLKSPYSDRNSLLLMYHNGASSEEAALRKVSWAELLNSPGGQWQPLPGNPRFKGVFRWKGWEKVL